MYRLISTCRLNHVFNKKQPLVRQSTVAVTKQEAVTTGNVKKIVRPKKIDRSPTDLLYTLSATVGRDSTGKDYKFHDDPFLAPKYNAVKERYALSQESGKRTAQWIRNNHGKIFNSDEAVPKIDAFMPKAIITDETDVTLDHLKDAIDSLNAIDAEMIYKLLQTKQIEIPLEMEENLLALVSFYNHQNPIPFDMFEERALQKGAERKPKTEFMIQWRENSFANVLFNKMESTPTAYNIMICAMYKYGAYDKAFALFKEAKQNQIAIDLTTYNSYLRHLAQSGPIQTVDLRWESIKSILQELNDLRIKPNLHTLNAVLATIRSAGNYSLMPKFATATIAEFQRLNIEPSLETYWHILSIFYAANEAKSPNTLNEILDRLEQNPDLNSQSVDDSKFFLKAINICRYRLRDGSQQAYRLDALVTRGDNAKFLGPLDIARGYYRDFLITILNAKPLEEFFEIYAQLVPDIYALEPSTVHSILSIIDAQGEMKYIPKLWTDILLSGSERHIHDVLMKTICENPPLDTDPNGMELNKLFGNIAWHLFEQMTTERDQRNQRNQRNDKYKTDTSLLHAGQISPIIIVLCRSKRFQDACLVVERALNQKKGHVIGCLTPESIDSFIDASIANNAPELAIDLIAYTIEMGINNSVPCARKLVQSLELEPHNMKKLTALVGHETLKN